MCIKSFLQLTAGFVREKGKEKKKRIVVAKGCGRNSLRRVQQDVGSYKVDKFLYFIILPHLTMYKDNSC